MRPTKYIKGENPYEKMWDTFVYFESESTTKSFLQEHYERVSEHPKRCAYDNATKFIYFIKQAREYYATAKESHILVKPLLLYYGMMSLMKAVVLKYDPLYPTNTGVLRHGMTTRKLKKTNYSFREDEVKIQKDGLLPHFTNLIYGPILRDQPKFKLIELISLIPELRDSFSRLYGHSLIYPLQTKEFEINGKSFLLPEEILDELHMTSNYFIDFLNRHFSQMEIFHLHQAHSKGYIHFCLRDGDALNHPRFKTDFKGKPFFLAHPEPLPMIPESCSHYITMYQLGMLCRYETELWGELIYSFQSEDTFIINEFLNVSMRKFPNLILNLLFDETLIFQHE